MESRSHGYDESVTVYLAWTERAADPDLEGPWTELRPAAPGVLLIESDHSLSEVYHHLKWSLPEDVALLVAPTAARPKAKGLAPGSNGWLAERLPLPADLGAPR